MEFKAIKSPSQKHTHFAAALSNHTCQSCKKSMLFTDPRRISKYFSHRFTKNLNHPTHKPTDTCKQNNWTTEKEAHAHNKGLAKVAVQWLIEHLCFVSSVVLADSFVLRIRHLRQAPNRYRQA